MAHEVESMFYAGEEPWHKLGVGVASAKTSAEAIKLAGLNWAVKLHPAFTTFGGKRVDIPGRFAVVRQTDGHVLGECGNRWQPHQNAEAFDFMDSLVQDRVLRYETAGSLRGGSIIWLLARLEEDMRIGDDEYVKYLLYMNRHDAEGPITAFDTDVRVVCRNTLRMAEVSGHRNRVRVIHNAAMHRKLDEARKVLEVSTAESRQLKVWLEKAAHTKVTGAQVTLVQDTLFGPMDDETPAQRRNSIETFQAIYAAEKAVAGATAYAVVNAVTGYADHSLRYVGPADKQEETRFMSMTDAHGHSSRIKQQGLAVVRTLVPVGK